MDIILGFGYEKQCESLYHSRVFVEWGSLKRVWNKQLFDYLNKFISSKAPIISYHFRKPWSLEEFFLELLPKINTKSKLHFIDTCDEGEQGHRPIVNRRKRFHKFPLFSIAKSTEKRFHCKGTEKYICTKPANIGKNNFSEPRKSKYHSLFNHKSRFFVVK